jgi:hypothetical protein
LRNTSIILIRSEPEEVARLRKIERYPRLKPKARLRAQVLRTQFDDSRLAKEITETTCDIIQGHYPWQPPRSAELSAFLRESAL